METRISEHRVEFGIWHDFRNPPPWARPYAQVYRENLEQISWAEQLGFTSVWLSEHHVTDDGYLPAIFPMLAAIAERTERMRLGTAIMLGPFQHPVRFAEDVAVVDQLSGGRVDIGLGLGYREREFELLGVPIAERARRTEQLVEVARRAWADGTVTPPPLQQPETPFWIGGSTPAAARRAARLGCNFIPGVLVEPKVLELYRSLGGSGQIAVGPNVYVGDWDEVAEHFLYQHNRYREFNGAEPLATPHDLPRERYVVGSPDEVAAGIRAIVKRTGCNRLYFWGRPPGLSIELANRSLERFARDVMPRVLES